MPLCLFCANPSIRHSYGGIPESLPAHICTEGDCNGRDQSNRSISLTIARGCTVSFNSGLRSSRHTCSMARGKAEGRIKEDREENDYGLLTSCY